LAFAADVSAALKSVDPTHLVSLGTIGTGQSGTAGDAYRRLHEAPSIDVVEAHDYGAAESPMPAAIEGDLRVAAGVEKPFFIGEAGIPAPQPTYAYSYEERARFMDAKIGAHWERGTAGFLVWSFYDLKDDNAGGWDFSPSDPLAAVLLRRSTQHP
jgi:hypothetical protein